MERVHTDGSGEYQQIWVNIHTETTPDTSQHNPFAERINRTLMDPVRVMLEESGLSAHYWEYSIEHVAYIKNRVIHSAIGCSPYEKLTGENPTLKHDRVFGCAAFVYNDNPRSKVHARAIPGIFLGFNDNGVYTVELSTSKKVVNSVHVTFDEDSFPGLENGDSSSSRAENSDANHPYQPCQSDSDTSDDELFPSSALENINSQPTTATQSQTQENQCKLFSTIIAVDLQNSVSGGPKSSRRNETPSPQLRKSARHKKQPDYFGRKVRLRANLIKIPITTSDEPTVHEELNSTPAEVKLWKKAIRKEFRTLQKKRTWSPVLNPTKSGASIEALTSHIVLKIKRNQDGHAKKFKARIVSGGHRQVYERDYDTFYAPVVSFVNFLLIIIIAFALGWFMRHVDVITAFPNGDIDRELYIKFPYNVRNCKFSKLIFILHKALYGLKQAPLLCYKKLCKFIVSDLKFINLSSDSSVFMRRDEKMGVYPSFLLTSTI